MNSKFSFRKIAPFASGALSLLLGLAVSSCSLSGIGDEPTPEDGVSESLHFNFKTPDWERKIDCTHLNLPSYSLSEEIYYTFATSQSTKATFFLSFPSDSSEIVKAANLKQYAIKEYGANDAAFQLSLKLPLNDGSSKRLLSKNGQSETSFNEITAITYLGHEEGEAVFKIKGKYQMVAMESKTSLNS